MALNAVLNKERTFCGVCNYLLYAIVWIDAGNSTLGILPLGISGSEENCLLIHQPCWRMFGMQTWIVVLVGQDCLWNTAAAC